MPLAYIASDAPEATVKGRVAMCQCGWMTKHASPGAAVKAASQHAAAHTRWTMVEAHHTPEKLYEILRAIRPGAGGRPKAGGYDLVTYNSTAPYMVVSHKGGKFKVAASQLPDHDADVIEYLLAQDALDVREA